MSSRRLLRLLLYQRKDVSTEVHVPGTGRACVRLGGAPPEMKRVLWIRLENSAQHVITIRHRMHKRSSGGIGLQGLCRRMVEIEGLRPERDPLACSIPIHAQLGCPAQVFMYLEVRGDDFTLKYFVMDDDVMGARQGA